jgi:predicted enzyme related to lactoylglutathione lyase
MPFKVGMLITIQHDIETAFEFYKNLGLEPKFHIKNRWAEFTLDNIKLILCPTEQELPDRHTGIVLEVADLKQLFIDLSAKNITFVTEPKEAPHGIMASIKDPGNNIIDLYQPTHEKITEIVKQAQGCCGSKDNCKSK